jgi:hypothetical protein
MLRSSLPSALLRVLRASAVGSKANRGDAEGAETAEMEGREKGRRT